MKLLKKLKYKFKIILFEINQQLPHIPLFNNPWTILRILFLSLGLCTIYSLVKINNIADIADELWNTLVSFSPYLLFQIIVFIIFSPIINKIKAIYAVFLTIALNLVSTLIVSAILINNVLKFDLSLNQIILNEVISLSIYFSFFIYFDWKEKNQDPANLIARLSFLQSKMKPHFLFNTLNTVLMLIKVNPDAASKIILNFSDLLRVSIREDGISLYSLNDELNICKKYLEIEKIRLGKRLSVDWDINDNNLHYLVPPLSIQPLVENAVLHGVQHLKNGFIKIGIQKLNDESINITIENNYNDKKHINSNHNNVSLNNLKERMAIIYQGMSTVTIKKDNNIFIVTINIPFIPTSTAIKI